MSMEVVPSLCTLPIELLYRLLDYLDIQTILLSFRYVAKKFYLVTDNSNHFHLDLSATSKSHFDLLCRLICPEKVVSIILSDESTTPGQIGLFFSLFRITDFPRLCSVTLQSIDSKDLPGVLTDILRCSLTSFSFSSRGKRNRSTFCLLSLLVKQSNLQTLSLNTHAHHIEAIFDSTSASSLVHLTAGIVTFNEYEIILRCCPHLRTFVIDDCWMTDTDPSSSIKPHRQVASLTLRNTNRSMAQLESLLPLTPALVQLKLISSPLTPNSLIDGSHWETLIKTKCLSMKRFHFVFHQLFLRSYECSNDVESLLMPFRTSFWLEEKRWFVNCQWIKSSHTIKLYSIPFSIPSYDYNFDPGNILLSTSLRNAYVMDHVRCLSLNLTEMKTKPSIKKEDFLFCKVIELKLRVDGEWPREALHFISTLVNLSNLQLLSFQSQFDQSTVSNTVDHLVKLVHQASNLSSLILLPLGADGQYHTTMANLCSIVSLYVKHLTLKIQKLDDMKIVVERLPHLSSVSFHLPSDRKINITEMIDWLISHGRDLTHLENDYSLHLWFGSHRH